jgi:hypothetical protein
VRARHGPALLRVIDVDRQEAAFVIMSVEQRELLLAVDDIAGVVDVQGDGCAVVLRPGKTPGGVEVRAHLRRLVRHNSQECCVIRGVARSARAPHSPIRLC